MVLSTACEHTYMLRASKTIESGAQQQKPYKCTISVTVADYQGSQCHTPIPIVHRFPFRYTVIVLHITYIHFILLV